MRMLTGLWSLAFFLAIDATASADDARLLFGGDTYAAGRGAVITEPISHDAFLVGPEVELNAPVSGDAHLAGFDVQVDADVAGDLYAAGFAVNVVAAVGGDVSAVGNQVKLRSSEPIVGNARLTGANVIIAMPIGGSALVTAQSLELDDIVSGDVKFYGETLTFGPGARVAGTLEIRAPKEILVPLSVASADRVRFVLSSPDYVSEAGRTADTALNHFWPEFWTIAGWLLVLCLVGALLIAAMPRTTRTLEIVAGRRPFRNFGAGVLAFAAALGLAPVLAMTVVGILLLPIVFVFLAVACGLAFLTGAYLIAFELIATVWSVETNLKRIGVLAGALVVAALIGMVPVAGWLITLGILFYGFGVMAVAIVARCSAGGLAPLPGSGAVSVPSAIAL